MKPETIRDYALDKASLFDCLTARRVYAGIIIFAIVYFAIAFFHLL